ncbi:hypothetical protein BGLA2_2290005 [Burkholderia gladioli]|nr:hypothetical protein BGLA2_2290005 [Burkholderia gladioli]
MCFRVFAYSAPYADWYCVFITQPSPT